MDTGIHTRFPWWIQEFIASARPSVRASARGNPSDGTHLGLAGVSPGEHLQPPPRTLDGLFEFRWVGGACLPVCARVRLWTSRVDNFMICGQLGTCSGQTGGWGKNLEISGQRVLCDAGLLA